MGFNTPCACLMPLLTMNIFRLTMLTLPRYIIQFLFLGDGDREALGQAVKEKRLY